MPNNYDTRVGPGGGAQMYVNGQWLDENLFSAGTGLQGELSPEQEANAGYAPGSAQSGSDPYLGQAAAPGSNLYEPWRTPTVAPATGVPGSPAVVPAAPKVNSGATLANKGDGYGDLANMYGQKAKAASNAGYTGVAKSVTSAQGSALAAASVAKPLSNQQTTRALATTKAPTTPVINKPAAAQPTVIVQSSAGGSNKPSVANLGGDQRAEERSVAGSAWVYIGDGIWFNTVTREKTNNPPPGTTDKGGVVGDQAALEHRKGEQNPTIPETSGNLPNSYDLYGVNDSGEAGVWSQPWNPNKSDNSGAAEAAQVDRYKAMAEQYASQRGSESGLLKSGGAQLDARGNAPIPRTPEQVQVTDAARHTGESIYFGQWPNLITNRVADELNYRGLGYNSSAEWLQDMGYMWDEAAGIWVRGDVGSPQITSTSGGDYANSGYGESYSYNWGDYGYGGYDNYGYGGGYGNGYGGGGSSYGNGGGLINWRIG